MAGLGQCQFCKVTGTGRISTHSVGQASTHFSQPVQASLMTA
jgi:hypothetical protein